jgi:hypothetical protein
MVSRRHFQVAEAVLPRAQSVGADIVIDLLPCHLHQVESTTQLFAATSLRGLRHLPPTVG